MASSTLVSIIIDEGLLLDSLPRVGGSLFYVLETAWSSVTERLRDFARSPEFAAKMELAFGQDVNRPLAKVLSRSLYSNIFEDYQLLINN
ncbi:MULTISPECIES: hypothetical protein [unclassified Microcystis]|uniref:hypothetical protein n=1 Tax=unclassified Microcystis TaxID=2643300 RepID=UPI0022C7F9EF|nr:MULTISPECIES: hypothetical protein [unclassified Microcystis]MCA2692547.1 hypothetical protein [Microcystis sp. M034S2]MCA2751503.1 hypothetical protein [Microcystis sp. M144S2]MCZ8200528.1 hypothetical protein [Microcystis sp. LE19-55.1A]MCZ8307175.1 hypothetical protein [Microcystis sp. LE19-98.1E]